MEVYEELIKILGGTTIVLAAIFGFISKASFLKLLKPKSLK